MSEDILGPILEHLTFDRHALGEVRGLVLPLVMGQDESGHVLYGDLADMPHMLVAGATGSGKSVFLNVVISSLLSWASPDDVQLVLIDPKQVEFSQYDGVEHLLFPVVTDAQDAALVLKWLIGEMERRFALLAEAGDRNILDYNAGDDTLPYIVVVIDELADLMMQAGDEIEPAIVRLAQKSRAVGIHLVLATQRPSVNVVTGLIKANVPARVAFALPSAIDSRTVIDRAGAETLRGRGDMLYRSGRGDIVRLQGALITDAAIDDIVLPLKCAICAIYQESDEIYPLHDANPRCESGGYNHCSCSTCF